MKLERHVLIVSEKSFLLQVNSDNEDKEEGAEEEAEEEE